MTSMVNPYDAARAAAKVVVDRTARAIHDVAVVLGSGWGPAADRLGAPDVELPMTDVPGFPAPSVSGHRGAIRSLTVRGVDGRDGHVLAFVGRTHLYEGHDPSVVVHGVRTAVFAGCRVVVLTNAAGGVDPTLEVGTPVLVSDHVNLSGHSALAGAPPPNDLGPRFVDLSDVYSARLRALAQEVEPLRECVYAMFLGPSYETKAEVRMARTLGADLVGMSTALEAIAARQLGAEVLGLSLVTNPAAGVVSQPIDHREVLAAGQDAAERLGDLLRAIVTRVIAA